MHYPVWRRSWEGIVSPHLLDLLGPAQRWADVVYPEMLSRRGWSMWIAEAGVATLGMVLFGPDSAHPEHVQIDSLYVDERHQRHGVGALLLRQAVCANPAADVILWCAEINTKGRRFYEKNDFRADGRTLDWEPLPWVRVPHLGYRLKRA
ncbi:GNAT family N-acetyltransferase [Mycobacterium parmense]|nr:GNAT family N-acetyltransferase [Mycobacterium parmense]ORW62521.1 GNAT family acetyltransferase [Mycobacterium parmense]